jgi:hypothetical protein
MVAQPLSCTTGKPGPTQFPRPSSVWGNPFVKSLTVRATPEVLPVRWAAAAVFPEMLIETYQRFSAIVRPGVCAL